MTVYSFPGKERWFVKKTILLWMVVKSKNQISSLIKQREK